MPVILLGLLLASDSTAMEAQVEHGRVLIRDMHEEEALAVLTPLRTSTDLPAGLRARAAVYAGIAWLDLDQEDRAREAFRAAIELDPGAALPAWVSRRVRALFDQEVVSANEARAKQKQLSQERVTAGIQFPVLVARPPAPPRSHVRFWLWGGAALAGGMAGLSFAEWDVSYRRAEGMPTATAIQRGNAQADIWWFTGEVLAGVGVALAGGGLAAWRLVPTERGAALSASGSF